MGLRKAYITSLSLYVRGSDLASKIIGHTNEGTTTRHYIDPQIMARELRHFKVFHEVERANTLDSLRAKNTVNKKKGLEK